MRSCARASYAVGQPEASFEVAAGTCTPAFVDTLAATYPQLEKILPRCALAINSEYVQGEASLAAGDEVAVLPPMSGG